MMATGQGLVTVASRQCHWQAEQQQVTAHVEAADRWQWLLFEFK